MRAIRFQKLEGILHTLLADAGFYSAANVAHCHNAGIQPLLARRRDQHYWPYYVRISEPPALSASADLTEHMLHRLKTPAGRARYGLRKQTVEPVFGIIKQASASDSSCYKAKPRSPASGSW